MFSIKKLKFNPVYFCLLFSMVQILFFVSSFFSINTNCSRENSCISITPFMMDFYSKGMLPGALQSFFLFFITNFALSFLGFWANYWTFGVLGTLFFSFNARILGLLVNLFSLFKFWLAVIFIMLEFLALSIANFSGVYFRLCKINDMNKKYRNIFIVMMVIAGLLILASFLEIIVIKIIKIWYL
ncbi:MAG: hypothetical protein CfP315_0018 [Candidatus Improbicoccus pseudotrichonymphae]|uniref:Uncharacterized protein n=1 Tax=Candidatus Improbicoccus pseudotrichonymphae TaxID=3033792 RepID=A0AA48L0L4_9FIRM|nr:MAG: hypothetical protein CfP315_0018 [Candidatus Improbicoccus pseudotrichonymphae]